MAPGRAAVGTLISVLLLVVLAPAPTAGAASYRYWQYWRVAPQATAWTFAATGPATRPADGAVEGWRFGVSGAAGDDRPRWAAAGLFEQVCGTATAPDGDRRVAVVIDFGTTADAPPAETPPAPVTGCAVLTGAENGYDALTEVAAARIGGGLICGIAGYPARECGVAVSGAAPATTAPAPAAPSSPAPAPAVSTAAGGGAGASGESGGDAPATLPSPTTAPGASPSTSAGGAASPAPTPSSAGGAAPADAVAAGTPPTSPVAGRTGQGSATGTLLGLLLIAGLGGGALWLRRGRS